MTFPPSDPFIRPLRDQDLLRALPDAPSLGEPGFDIPDLSQMNVIEITDDTDVDVLKGLGIDIRIDRSLLHPGKIRARVYHDSSIQKRNMVVLVSNRTIDATLVMANKHGIDGRLQLNGVNCWYIDTGSAQRASSGSIHLLSDNSVFYFGADATANHFSTTCKGAGKHVLIGRDCMLATELLLYATDFHGVFDTDTRKVLNEDQAKVKSIVLEPHVWLASRVIIGKGVRIGQGSIVGASSVVTRDVPSCVAVAGNPARVIKEHVSWTRTLQPSIQNIDDVLNDLSGG